METGEKKNGGEKRSFVRSVSIRINLLLFMLLLVLVFTAWNAARTLTENTGEAMLQTVETGLHALDRILDANSYAVSVLAAETEDLEGLNGTDEIAKSVSAQNLLTELNTLARSNPSVSYLFVFNPGDGLFLTRGAAGVPNYVLARKIENAVQSILTGDGAVERGRWFFLDAEGEAVFCRLYRARGTWIGAAVPLSLWTDQLVITDSSWYFCLRDEAETFVYSFGNRGLLPEEGMMNGPAPGRQAWIRGGRALARAEKRNGFVLTAAVPRGAVYGRFQVLQVLLIGMVFVVIAFAAALYRYMRSQILGPTGTLIRSMETVENGDYSARVPEGAPNREFATIGSSFNRMLDTIVNLRLQSYEDRIQFDEATLKYVQLQIRPHFFLNALTTIHSMSFQDRNEDIRAYIESLSSNIRYLFKAGLHTVPLSEEIEHVREYIRMQDMLYPGAVFDFIHVEDEARDYAVPQLLIHTLLENIYKHAVSVDRLTCILVDACLEERDGEKLLHLAVEDDGDGFPSEFLEQMKEGEVKVREDGHGVGLWNLKKTLELMYRREDLIAFSNKTPNGARTDVWIPKRPKRQSSVWQL